MFCTCAGLSSLSPNSKLCKSKTSLKLIKTPQNFVQESLSKKLTQIYHNSSNEVLT